MRFRQAMDCLAALSLLTTVLLPCSAKAQYDGKIEIVPQLGHSKSIDSVSFSPSGRTVLTGSSDNTVKLWDLATGHQIRELKGHTNPITAIGFALNGMNAVSAAGDMLVQIKHWDLTTGNELTTLDIKGIAAKVTSVAMLPDGQRVLLGGDEPRLSIWDLRTGEQIRFKGHTEEVTSIALLPGSKFALTGSRDKTLKLWDLAKRRVVRTFKGHSQTVTSIAISADGKTAISGGADKTAILWNVAAGREIRRLQRHSGTVVAVSLSVDGKTARSASQDGTLTEIKIWDTSTGRELKTLLSRTPYSVGFSADGKTMLSGGITGELKLYDLSSGEQIREFTGNVAPVRAAAILPDGKAALTGQGSTMRLWDLATGSKVRDYVPRDLEVVDEFADTNSLAISADGRIALNGAGSRLTAWEVKEGKEIQSFKVDPWERILAVALSPDGTKAVAGASEGKIRYFDLTNGSLVYDFKHTSLASLAMSPDGKLAISGGAEGMALWDLTTGTQLKALGEGYRASSVAFSPNGEFVLSATGYVDQSIMYWNLATGALIHNLKGHYGDVTSIAFTADGRSALSSGSDKTIRLWDLERGEALRTFYGHSGEVSTVSMSRNGKFALSGGLDGTIRLWDPQHGRQLLVMVTNSEGEYAAMTPSGFFNASHRDTNALAIVRQTSVTTLGQVHQSLFNPDLVRESLAGDTNGEVQQASSHLDLDKIIDSGPAPKSEITSHGATGQSEDETVSVAARITDQGKGIGRVEWRLNGVTAGVRYPPPSGGVVYETTREFALDPGKNTVEVLAYNAHNLLASAPATISIELTSSARPANPKLHVLAIGVNEYVDEGGKRAVSDEVQRFPPLALAVGDAKGIAAEFEKASLGLYSEVRVKTALDKDVTRDGLDRIVSEMADEISPRDTFVFFAAAHGYSTDGRFFLIPQDYQGGPDPAALTARAIGQEQLQDWVANRIKASKAIFLLDTCESGALVGGYVRSRVDAGSVSEAAIGRLHEATGRPVLTAAAAGQDALEITKLGHGVFTSALIQALRKGDRDQDGLISVSELAAHVQDLVPKLVAGGESRSAYASRGDAGGIQSARFGSRGEDFVLVKVRK